ncbi:MAG TPA: hypothetical protein VNS63_03100 [Blastocatellia bacterium]|nr:hypothetical protein [Blastocatellia bacterium]
MKNIGMNLDLIAGFVALVFLTMLVIDAVFIWQLLRINARPGGGRRASAIEKLDTQAFSPDQEPALLEPRMSVTESTTQNFEPAHDEKKSIQ